MTPIKQKPQSSTSTRTRRDALYQALRHAIQSDQLQAGERIAPLRELAQQYDVSYSTVRHVLIDLENLGLIRREPNKHAIVIGRSQSADTDSCQSARPQQHALDRSIYILYETRDEIQSPIVNHMTEMLLEHGLRASVIGQQVTKGIEQFEALLDYWQNNPPRTVINCLRTPGLHQAIAKTCGPKTRQIGLNPNYIPPGTAMHQIDLNYQAAAQLAVEHLLAHDHQKIGVIVHRRQTNLQCDDVHYTRKRHSGHTPLILAVGHALRQNGLDHAMKIVYRNRLDDLDHSPTSRQTIEQFQDMLKQPDTPTAFIGQDFTMAYLMLAARELGLTPGKDLQIVGLGNTSWSQLFGFSSIDFGAEQIARKLIELAEMSGTLIDGTSLSISMQPQLVNRCNPGQPSGHLSHSL